MKKTFLFFALLLLTLPLFAQNADMRGLKTVVSQLGGGTADVGRQYAVLIAVNRYKSWMGLRNPVKDAKEIKEILARKYFISDFLELYDEAATKAGIIRLFNRLITEAKPEDSILVFYAGHGHLDKTSNTGFWIPVDGGTDVDEQANWLPNAQIRGFVSNMKARHVALITDSCFSGDFLNPTRGIAPTITNEYFKKAYSRVSRQVLTSGASESVPDESPFTRQLKLALEGNTAPYLDPLMLYNQIRLGVTQTTPLFGDLKDSGHQEGSSFLLFLKKPGSQPEKQAAAPTEPAKTSFKIEKVYGTVRVEGKTEGSLSVDGTVQGQVPIGTIATIENLEFGSHVFEMEYENGETEQLSVTIDRKEPISVQFRNGAAAPVAKAAEVPADAPAAALAAAPAEDAVPLKDELDALDRLPTASIKIDGNFDDWNGVPAAIRNPSSKAGKLGIETLTLAVDSRMLYAKIDINDPTPPSFFHPSNFDTDHNSVYKVAFENGRVWAILEIVYDASKWGGRWTMELGRTVDGKWDPDRNSGNYALKGSSLEMSYPLERIKDYLAVSDSTPFKVTAQSGYSDANWKWVEGAGDSTPSRLLRF
jgi:hypothetical protein